MTRARGLPYWCRRVRRHLGLGVVSATLTAGAFVFARSDHVVFRWSIASAYAGLLLLGGTLITGPWNVLRRRPNPVSTDVRRDIGIWSGVLGLVHVAVGLQVHMGGNIWQYFFDASGHSRLIPRFDAFGLANHVGLGATLILVVLLALSNDRSLRWLGTRRWKWAHRSAYVAFALVVGHGVLYQLIEKRSVPFVTVFVTVVVVVTSLQLAGFRYTRRLARRARTSTREAIEDLDARKGHTVGRGR